MGSMRVITQDGYVSLQALEILVNEGLISVPEWEHAVIETYISNMVDTGKTRCDHEWSQGCKPAKWGYIDEYSTADGTMSGYLCESCADCGVLGQVINLQPLHDGVYAPDVDTVIRNNYALYCRMSYARGLRVF